MRDQEPMTILLAGKTGGLSESIATMIVRLGIEETNEMCSRGTFVEIANSSRRLPEYIDSYIENQCDPTVLWIEGVKKSPDAAADLLDRIIQCRIADGKITVLTSDLHNTELMEMLHEVGDALTGTKVVSFDFDGASTSFDLVKLRDKIDRMIMAGVATATHEEILAICKGLK